MQEKSWTDFGGISGRVINGALGFRSLFSGIVLVVLIALSAMALQYTRAPAASFIVGEVIFALVLARFALNGLHGEYVGSLDSTSGGPWTAVFQISLRHLTLSILWMAPLFVLGYKQLSPEAVQALALDIRGGLDGGFGEGRTVVVLGSFLLLSIVATPIFLTIAVGATRFVQIFSTAHWKRTFAGRLNDLEMIYILVFGSMGVAILWTSPLVILVGIKAPKAGFLLALLSLCFLIGLAATVLGRLAGVFATNETETPATETIVSPNDDQAAAAAAPSDVPASLEKPPLKDAGAIVTEAERLFQEDPSAGIEQLDQARSSNAPHPMVLLALTRMELKGGKESVAVELAREAIEVCLRGGMALPAAQLVGDMWPLIGEIRPTQEQLEKLAHALIPNGDLFVSTRMFLTLVRSNPFDDSSIKGLMKIAELQLLRGEEPRDSIRIYQFLMRHCATSPMAKFFAKGLEKAQRAA